VLGHHQPAGEAQAVQRCALGGLGEEAGQGPAHLVLALVVFASVEDERRPGVARAFSEDQGGRDGVVDRLPLLFGPGQVGANGIDRLAVAGVAGVEEGVE